MLSPYLRLIFSDMAFFADTLLFVAGVGSKSRVFEVYACLSMSRFVMVFLKHDLTCFPF